MSPPIKNQKPHHVFADIGYGGSAGGGEIAKCSNPNDVVCQNDDPINPTKCTNNTKGLRCDKEDFNCVCRYSKFVYECTCGYDYPD